MSKTVSAHDIVALVCVEETHLEYKNVVAISETMIETINTFLREKKLKFVLHQKAENDLYGKKEEEWMLVWGFKYEPKNSQEYKYFTPKNPNFGFYVLKNEREEFSNLDKNLEIIETSRDFWDDEFKKFILSRDDRRVNLYVIKKGEQLQVDDPFSEITKNFLPDQNDDVCLDLKNLMLVNQNKRNVFSPRILVLVENSKEIGYLPK
jgi:hypothetical protein